MKYLIWSIEHDAWWRPDWAGYTRVLAEAGRYTEGEAANILARANYISVNECKVPVEAVEDTAPLQAAPPEGARAALAVMLRSGTAPPEEYRAWLQQWMAGKGRVDAT